MAGDWIKMRTDLYRDPKVCLIADHLMRPGGELATYVNQNCQRDMTVTRNVMRNVTVGALVTLWGVARNRGRRDGDDLLLRNASLHVIDDVSELPGLGEALEYVGWVTQTAEGVVFPRFFEEYNVDISEIQKQKNAERQRRYREKRNEKRNVTRDVTVTSKSNVRIEKEKENNKRGKSSSPVGSWKIPERLDTPEVRQLLDEFAEMRSETGKPIKNLDRASSTLGDFDDARHLAYALRTCIANEYQGLKTDYRPPVVSASASDYTPPKPRAPKLGATANA